MQEFYDLARQVSRLTYQEKLGMNARLPDEAGFPEQLKGWAANDAGRGYLLFDGERPVSFLLCPIAGGKLLYEHVGYDPDYRDSSPGTVLLYLVLERLFAEKQLTAFDFTEGEGSHKEFFANRSVRCADIYFFRRTLKFRSLLWSHTLLWSVSRFSSALLDRTGLKASVKRLLRR